MTAASVEGFLSEVPSDARPVLEGLRRTVLGLVPEPGEKISYGIPVISYRGRPLVGYGATRTHCALYVMSTDAMATLAEDLRGYDLGKGTIRFPSATPLPDALVRRVVETRIAEVDAALTRPGRDA